MNVLGGVVVVLAIVLACALAGVRLVGLEPYVVLSGSMEPTYHTGSLIYDKEVDAASLAEGDVITFVMESNTVATHRIVEVVTDESSQYPLNFRTKGDANENVDGALVNQQNVLGTPVFTIPYLGYFSSYIQNPPGRYIAIAVALVALVLVFLPDLLFRNEEEPQGAHA